MGAEVMGMKKEMNETDNRTVYRRCYKWVVTEKIGRCSFCQWHRGENASRKPKFGHRKLNKIRRGIGCTKNQKTSG